MKKIAALMLALLLCLGLCACGSEEINPEDSLETAVETYIVYYLDDMLGAGLEEEPKVVVASYEELSENSWAVLGIATMELVSGDVPISSKFGVVMTYEEEDESFYPSELTFDIDILNS